MASLRLSLLGHCIKRNVWTNGGEYERLAEGLGYKASNASRRMRELHNDHLVERKIENGSVWYRASIVQETSEYDIDHPRLHHGDKEYDPLHDWVRSQLGTPNKCERCGNENSKRYEWANKSGEYKKDLTEMGKNAPVASQNTPVERVTPQDRLFPLPALKPKFKMS